MLRDLRYAFRGLTRNPGFTAVAILTLALGIGATTAVFSVVDQTLLRSAPFAYADRLVDVLSTDRKTGGSGNIFTPAKIIGWQRQRSIFERFEAYAPRVFDMTETDEPERISGLVVSTGLLPMLEVYPQLGRGFAAGEGRPASERLVLISDALWRRRFASDSAVLGRRLVLNDDPYTIIGVMPRRFRLLSENDAVWIPVDLSAVIGDASQIGFYGLGRLREGLTVESAQQQADVIADQLQAATPLPKPWDVRLEKKRVARVRATTETALFVLLGAVGFVLLIACANVANLFLTQVATRGLELAIRSALGASRMRLICQVLTEGFLLAVIAGVCGIGLAIWGVDLLVSAAPANLAFMSTTPIEIDRRVVVVAIAVSCATALLFGLLPALRGSRPNLNAELHGSTASTARRSYGRIPYALIVAEVAISLVLLVGAALMMRTMTKLEAIEPGFNPKNLVTLHVDLPTDRYPTAESRSSFFARLSENLMALPGISGVAVANGVPPQMGDIHEGVPKAEGGLTSAQSMTIQGARVTPSYLRNLGIPLVAGRGFTDSERDDAVIVSEALARRFWPDGSAVSRRFRPYENFPWQTIVGVVGNVEARVGEERTAMQIYSPWERRSRPPAKTAAPTGGPRRRGYALALLIVRTENPSDMIPAIKAQVWALDKNQPVERVALVEDLYAESFARQRFVLLLMTVFAAFAVGLTAIGIFGVLAQAVAQRRREIGIRVALGAMPADVLRLVVGRGVRLTVGGAIVGLAGAAALSRFSDESVVRGEPIRSGQLRGCDSGAHRCCDGRVLAAHARRDACRARASASFRMKN